MLLKEERFKDPFYKMENPCFIQIVKEIRKGGVSVED
jgi:hypothetical protein